MDMITVSAKTLDEAITKALIELQTTSDHLHYEVIQKESSGLLGIFGVKPCVIRARVMSEAEEAAKKKAAAEKERAAKEAELKAEREARAAKEAEKKAAEKKAAEKAAAERAAAEKKAASEKAASEKTSAKPAGKPAEKTASRPSEKPGSGQKPSEKNAERFSEKKDFQKRENRRDQDRRREQPRREEKAVEAAVPVSKPRIPVNVDADKVQKDAKEFLEQVFGAMGMKVSIETAFDAAEGELQVMMEGEDMGILIGKRGQTLDSLQYLVSLVVNKETDGYLRVKLDTENYRERRKETLETLAKNISYKVKRTKHPVSLEPMNPYERRIIHSALQNDRYVTTRSEGEDPYRHVVIALKKESYGNGGGRRDRYPSRKDRSGNDRGDRNDRNREGRFADRGADRQPQILAEKTTEQSAE